MFHNAATNYNNRGTMCFITKQSIVVLVAVVAGITITEVISYFMT